MAMPLPPKALDGSCSVIHDDTLYVYTPEAFQSIRLAQGEDWLELEQGVPTTGASCVYAAPGGNETDAVLYVVGGISDETQGNYSGLQMYSFGDQKWTSITMQDPIASNRTNHAATYLQDSQTILVYSGSQRGPQDQTPSTETFCVYVKQNYLSQAYSGNNAPSPRMAPQLTPWNTTHATMVGGDGGKDIYLFTAQPDPWTKLLVELTEPIKDRDQAQAIVVDGDDDSKVLEIFDLGDTPSKVTRLVVQGAGGQEPTPGQTVGDPPSKRRRGSSLPPSKRRKRDLSVANWPVYNSTSAPSTSRSGFSIAKASNDTIVMTGGDDQVPVLLFNNQQNSFINSTEFFGPNSTAQSLRPSATSSRPSATASASASSTSSILDAAGKSKSLKILGATLGGVFGLAIFLALILVLLRWCRKRRQYTDAGHQRRSSGAVDEDRLSFADRGVSFREDGFAMPRSFPRKSTQSTSSAAIIGGRSEQPPQRRGLFSKGRTGSSSSSIFSKVRGKSPLGGEMQMEEKPGVSFAPSPVIDGPKSKPTADGSGKQRSSGWSRYFSGTSATNLAHMESGRSTTYTHKSHSSHGSQTPLTHSRKQSQPLTASATPGNLSRANSGNLLKNIGPSRSTQVVAPANEGLAHQMVRQDSSSTLSSVSRDDAFSSGIPASVHDETSWSPMGKTDWNGRATSSIYTDSNRGSMIPREDSSSYFPRDSTATRFPRASNATNMPPRGPGITITQTNNKDIGAASHTDMSWLNLGSAR